MLFKLTLRCEIWCPSGSDDDCPDDHLCFAFSKCHAGDMNSQTLAQIEKQKEEDYAHLIGNTGSSSGSGGAANSFATTDNNPIPRITAAPIPADQVPGYYDVMLGGSTRPTRMPTKRPTNKPVISDEQAMHRYSFCGAYWVDVSIYSLYSA